MDTKDFKLKLEDPKFLEEFCNHVVIAKIIADKIAENNSYESIVKLADDLDITIEEVNGYLQLFKYVQRQMII